MKNLFSRRVGRRFHAFRFVCLAALFLAAARPAGAASPLSPDDVTWLFPPPAAPEDLADLVSIGDVTMQTDPVDPSKRAPVWSDAAFKDFLAVADGPKAVVDGAPDRIGLPPEARQRANWFIAGIRIDPGAPGLAHEVTDVYGRRPQIRIILQPVNRQAGRVVDDVAAHLIFDFVTATPGGPGACPLRASPDDVAFRSVIDDVASLRDKLADGQFGSAKVVTAGEPLEVHPGLSNRATRAGLTAAMKDFLQRQLAHAQLNAMALMALPSGKFAPWIFVAMNKAPGSASFDAVPGPTLSGVNQFAMELTPNLAVLPVPHTNNLAPITCMSAALGPQALPVSVRKGVATADLMAGAAAPRPQPTEVFDRIANTSQSHFFNTDCISCHTATQMANAPVEGISPTVLQAGIYDVHNFGWSTDLGLKGSVARRTATETADVVAWLNMNMPPR